MTPPDFRRVLVITGDHALPDATKWDAHFDTSDLELHDEMRAALESLEGHTFEFVSEHQELAQRVLSDPPDFALNLCDTGFRNIATQELHIPALLEMAGVPYSGAAPAGMVLCYDKSLVRLLAASLGVPVPSETAIGPEVGRDDAEMKRALEGISYPAFIKPSQGDGSVGITRDAVVNNAAEALATLEGLRRTLPGCTALVQEYLPGPEYGLALVGNPGQGFTGFPPLEVDFSGLAEGLPPILAFESKTGPETPYAEVEVVPARLAPDAIAGLRRHAELLFARLHCRDYARFDFRTGADGVIKLLEVNPNPAWSASAKLALMAGFAGVSYRDLWRLILDAAKSRVRATPSATV